MDMTKDQETTLMIRGFISTLPNELQAQVKAAYSRIKDIEQEFGEEAGRLAVGLRGAELAE